MTTPTKILYLHGLDGSSSQEKKEALENCFQIVAPTLDYRNTPNMFEILSELLVSENIDAVIGNSMGGCFAYYLSLKHSIPALCFNPALCFRPIAINLPELEENNNPIIFILGGQDDTVPVADNFEWIRKNPNKNFALKWYNEMGHRVDIQTFSHEVELFEKDIALLKKLQYEKTLS
jgi:pimeloyl-ACP methyl ester carboxylesterase